MMYLTEDIVRNILIRMHKKPLLWFKRVSRQWNRLISDPNFLKSRSRPMILIANYPFHAIDNNVPVDNDTYNSTVMLRSPLKDTDAKVVGTVNGLVLLLIEKHDSRPDMMLYNPFTGAFNKLPDPPSSYCSSDGYTYGLGHGATHNDIKIVTFVRLKVKGGPRTCDVYNLKTRSWSTPLELNMDDYLFLQNKGTFVNGFLYWVALRNKRVIVSLSVKNMVFLEIQSPPAGITVFPLGTFKGHLCTICKPAIGKNYELWVMNEHGVTKTWSKVCSLAFTIDKRLMRRLSWSMCILDDGKLVMNSEEGEVLIIYDMLKDSYKNVKALTASNGLNSIEYVETCVSPLLII